MTHRETDEKREPVVEKPLCCKGLEDAFEDSESRRPALVAALFVNFTTGSSRQRPVLYSGAYRKRGLILSWCPCCGKDLLDSKEREAINAQDVQL